MVHCTEWHLCLLFSVCAAAISVDGVPFTTLVVGTTVWILMAQLVQYVVTAKQVSKATVYREFKGVDPIKRDATKEELQYLKDTGVVPTKSVTVALCTLRTGIRTLCALQLPGAAAALASKRSVQPSRNSLAGTSRTALAAASGAAGSQPHPKMVEAVMAAKNVALSAAAAATKAVVALMPVGLGPDPSGPNIQTHNPVNLPPAEYNQEALEPNYATSLKNIAKWDKAAVVAWRLCKLLLMHSGPTRAL
jgi:hypothetical protein